MRVVIAMVAALGSACALIDPCDNDSFKEFKSPEGNSKVVVFQRSCGATTGFSTQVSVLRADSPVPKKQGNALIIDSNHGAVAVDRDGLIDVEVKFAADASVTLAYPAQSRIFVEATKVDGIVIHHVRQ